MSLKDLIQRATRALSGQGPSRGSVHIQNISQRGSGDQSISIVNGRVFINGVEQNGKDAVKPRGPIEERERPIGDFSGLLAGACFDIAWSPGAPGLRVRAPQNLHELIRASVDAKGDLALSIEGVSELDKGAIQIECSSKALERVELSGAAQGSFHGVGPGPVELSCSGASEIIAEGRCERLRARSSGSARLDASRAPAGSAEASSSGSSSLRLSVERSLELQCSGSSQARVSGSGEARIEASGSSAVEHLDGEFQARARASGAARLSLRLQGDCSLSASGSSVIEHSGDARVAPCASGAASIRHAPARRPAP